MKLDKTSKYVFDILNVNFEVMTFSKKQVKTLKLVTFKCHEILLSSLENL